MSAYTTIHVKCRFTRGGFAHERVFWIPAPEGQGAEYRGLAYIGYCFRPDRSPLATGEPPAGESIDGLLEARLVVQTGGLYTIEVPDGETCDIDPSLIEDSTNVLVGS